MARGESGWELKIPPQVDVVVANPPYIRQEIIPDKQLCRKHLERLGYKSMSDRSDIYVYFFTHATEFLREKGRIGFITSDKWLTVGYGRDLQEFFLDNFKIKAIISFSKRVFKVPLVPACVTILEKCHDDKERESNIVKFIRLKGGVDLDKRLDDLIRVVETDYELDLIKEERDYRLSTKRQTDLKEVEKWNRCLYAPPVYWKILNHEKVCRLNDVADVNIGNISGANDFFYIKEREAGDWGINERFLRPVAKSIRQTDTVEITKDDTDMLVIDVHNYVKEKLEGIPKERIKGIKLDKSILPRNAHLNDLSPKEEYILHNLHQDGYEGLFKYIVHTMWEKDWGRLNPPQKRPRCLQHRQQNECWFNLGELRAPDLMIPETCWKRIFTMINRDNLAADRNLYEIHTEKNVEELAGILNSDMHRMLREIHGRITGGGANRVVVYEARDLPILDPDSLSREEKQTITKEFEKIRKNGKIISSNLNKAVLKPLGLEERSEDISAYADALSKARREGKEAGEMVAGIEEKAKPGELEGAKIIREGSSQRKLDEFS